MSNSTRDLSQPVVGGARESESSRRGQVIKAVSPSIVFGVAMGLGRFVFTPILPLMEHQAGLTASGGAMVATANYLGYLVGAVAAGATPRLFIGRATLRVALVLLTCSVALMACTSGTVWWSLLRFISGVSSALLFVQAARSTQDIFRGRPHLTGWAYGGVGAGIAVSGVLVLLMHDVAPSGSWRAAWAVTAVLCAAGAAVTWTMPVPSVSPTAVKATGRASGWKRASLFTGYGLEGVGYIITATFLVAALSASGAPSWLGGSAWIIVGLAACPSCLLWTAWTRRVTPRTLLFLSLLTQTVAVMMTALTSDVWLSLAGALGFGGTFMAVTTLTLALGGEIGSPRTIPALTAIYGAGQVAGPLLVQPLLTHGYRTPLLLSSALVLGAALCTAPLLCFRPRPQSAS